MFLVLIVLAIVPSTIWPGVDTPDVQLVLFPASFVPPSVRPFVDTLSVDEVALPLTVVLGAVAPFVNTLAMFHAVMELTTVYASVLQNFDTVSLLQVIDPVPLVGLTTLVLVFAKAVGFIVKEFTLEYIAVRVEKSTLAICFSILPFSHVARIIWPSLGTVTVLQIRLPINGSFIG